MLRLKHFLELHFVIFLWGFTAILGKLIHIPAVELVLIRTLISAAALGAIIYFNRTRFWLGWPTVLRILGVGVMLAGHWLLFFASARVSSVSICLAGLATSSLWTALLEPAFTDKKVRAHEVLLAILIMLGLYVIFQFEFGHFLGITMALGSALLGAGFTIINSRLTKQYPPTTIACYEMTGACLVTLFFLPVYLPLLSETGQLQFQMPLLDWFYLLVLALVCTVYAFTAAVRLMQRITAFAMNLTVNLEPIYGIILAWFIFGKEEEMSKGFYIGAAIILASVFIYPLLESRYNRRQKQKQLTVNS